jgi:2-polyprenyl-3-methyl-5-hydroxy-6-metoxy-1,4-benzoquinol methylase
MGAAQRNLEPIDMSDQRHSVADVDWQQRYESGDTLWDSGAPSQELERILAEGWIRPCRALELGGGSGTNAIFLASQGFEVTAIELAPNAVKQAEQKARAAGVGVRFLAGDVLALPDLGEPFPFVFDRGVYHVLREVDVDRFRKSLASVTRPGSLYLTLAGNANEQAPADAGPPRVRADELLADLSPLFDVVQLREFQFDGVCVEGRQMRPLAWSALWRRR